VEANHQLAELGPGVSSPSHLLSVCGVMGLATCVFACVRFVELLLCSLDQMIWAVGHFVITRLNVSSQVVLMLLTSVYVHCHSNVWGQ